MDKHATAETTTFPLTERLHALDNARAAMMWLGIVLHVAVNHMASPSNLPWRDSQTSVGADLVVLLIHAFRMPVFFILAGFFAARMVDRRGAAAMFTNRLRRIGLPLLVFWPLLVVATACLVLVYLHLMRHGSYGIDTGMLQVRERGVPAPNTMHLWFLLDLLWLCGLAAAAAHLARRWRARPLAHACVGRILGSWWGPFLLAVPLALIGLRYPNGIVIANTSLLPDLADLAHNGLFFAGGWALYVQRAQVFARLQGTIAANALLGLVAFVFSLGALGATAGSGKTMSTVLAAAYTYNCAAWCWSLALIGAALKYAGAQRPSLRYLADSAYWVYLVHMLGTIGFGVLLYQAPMGVAAKMVANIGATTLVCLLSYHFLVRGKAIDRFLNGRPRVDTTVAPVATMSAGGR